MNPERSLSEEWHFVLKLADRSNPTEDELQQAAEEKCFMFFWQAWIRNRSIVTAKGDNWDKQARNYWELAKNETGYTGDHPNPLLFTRQA